MKKRERQIIKAYAKLTKAVIAALDGEQLDLRDFSAFMRGVEVARDCLLEMTAEEVIACAEFRITNERKEDLFERDDEIQWGKLVALVSAIFQKSKAGREKGTSAHI